jgi:hypothetical protein
MTTSGTVSKATFSPLASWPVIPMEETWQVSEVVAALTKEFSNHRPPVEAVDCATWLLNRTPTDKVTGRLAMVLSVDVLDPVDGTEQAIGKWYSSGAVSGFYPFTLLKNGNDWLIENFR